MNKHLWEIDHPYYCNEGNYFTSTCVHDEHKTWADFYSAYSNADFDLNLLFRFDWTEDEDAPFNGDKYYRNGILKIFWMGQRKGIYRYSTVEVCRADEPAVIEFLKPRWDHMRHLWEGVSDWTTPDNKTGEGE